MIDLHKLRIFVLVAEKKSFSEAAEAMLLTQPTVSSHIRSLEEDLGVILFDRLPRSIELTGAGRVLYRHCREIIRLHEAALHALREFSGKITGTLEVGGSTIPGEYILPPLLRRFRETAPEVRVNLRIGDSREITSAVIEGELELGLVGAKPSVDSLESAPFCKDRLVLIVSPVHPLAARGAAAIPWREILREPLWLREPGSGSRQALEKAMEGAGKGLNDLAVLGWMGSTEAIKQAVASGAGAAVISSLAVRHDLACNRLAALELEGLDLTRNFHIIRHRHRTPSPAARVFHEFISAAGRETA